MAIVINGSGTVTGLAVGGLPDGTVDTDTLANTTVTAAKVAADVATQAEIDAKLNLAGGTLTGDLNFGDNVDANFGAGADLKIYHDGSDSIIHDTGTGDLYIKGSAEVLIRSATNENMIKCVADGAVSLYNNNSVKLNTGNSGVSVTGRINVSDGITITDGTTEDCLLITANSSDHNLAKWVASNSNADQQSIMQFYRNGGLRGSISTSNSATAFNTSSDYRLKENVDYTWDATTRLKQLKPARFNWIADETNTLVDGFIAHEVTSVVPEAVCGAKDAVDSDGNIDAQGIDQSKLVPLLVKTIQELEARITALEA